MPSYLFSCLRSKVRASAICSAGLLFVCGVITSCNLPRGSKFRTSGDTEYRESDGTVVRKAIVETEIDTNENLSSIDDTARYFAGLPGGKNSPLANARRTDQWARHAESINELWRRFEASRKAAINSWADGQLGRLRRPETLFYPFSGPDFLFADAFFPGASVYLFSGLESCEPLPDVAALSEEERIQGLNGLTTSLTTNLNFSFFITKDMKVDLQRTAFKGTLPILLTFLARTGHAVDNVEYLALSGDGSLVPRGGGQSPSFRITFRKRGFGAFNRQTLYYSTTDLSDGEFSAGSRYGRFVRGFGSCVTFVKSASYLMHEPYFHNIRDAILVQSQAILQDDSGIPLRGFDAERWNVKHYGRYSGVLDIFTKYYQSDLAQAHEAGAEPLGFGIGYRHTNGQSAMTLALRR